MYRFVRFRWSWPLLAFLVVLSGCQSASEEDLAQKVKDSESPAEQILASREYLARFSDGARRSEVADKGPARVPDGRHSQLLWGPGVFQMAGVQDL